MSVDPDTFVQVWQSAETKSDVVKKLVELGMSENSITSRATSYRKKGLPLKNFRGGKSGPRLDVEELKRKYFPEET